MRFSVALHSDDGKAFGASVPDLPGCFSAGDTIDEAIENVMEAIEAHVELLAEAGMELPSQRSYIDAMKLEAQPGATWALVDVDVERFYGPAEKINITVPAITLRRIDSFAQKQGKTRSGFLVDAAIRMMGVSQQARKDVPPKASAAVAGKKVRRPARAGARARNSV